MPGESSQSGNFVLESSVKGRPPLWRIQSKGEDSGDSLEAAIDFVSAIDVDNPDVILAVATADDADDDDFGSAVRASNSMTDAMAAVDSPDLGPTVAKIAAEADDGPTMLNTVKTLSDVRRLLARPFAEVDLPAAVQCAVDLVQSYAPDFRPGHAPRDGRCPGCDRTVEQVLLLRETSVHGRVTVSEPEVVGEPPLAVHRLRHLRSHLERCMARRAIREQAPGILGRAKQKVPAGLLSAKGAESTPDRYPEVLRRLYGEDFQDDNFKVPRCSACPGKPELRSKALAINHLLLAHNTIVPYSPPPPSIEPGAAGGSGLEAVFDFDFRLEAVFDSNCCLEAIFDPERCPYLVDPKDQQLFAVRTLRELVKPASDGSGFRGLPDIVGPAADTADSRAQDSVWDQEAGACFLCATNPLLPPVEQARFFKDLRSHRAKCLRDHVRLLMDLEIDPAAHSNRDD